MGRVIKGNCIVQLIQKIIRVIKRICKITRRNLLVCQYEQVSHTPKITHALRESRQVFLPYYYRRQSLLYCYTHK